MIIDRKGTANDIQTVVGIAPKSTSGILLESVEDFGVSAVINGVS